MNILTPAFWPRAASNDCVILNIFLKYNILATTAELLLLVNSILI
jgi:hypothetical protein